MLGGFKMTLSFAEIESQRLELLPARTVMSIFTAGNQGGSPGHGGGGNVSCALSIGNLGIGIGAILGAGTGGGVGTSC
jgi:hypothetical protein